MLGATFQGAGQLELKQVPDPSAGPGEVLVKVGANTVCGTDVRILRGEKSKGINVGVVLGHETAGEVVEVGAGVSNYTVGDRVAIEPEVTCGRCWYCEHQLEQFCPEVQIYGYIIDGGLGEYCKLTEQAVRRSNAVVCRTDLPFEHMALMEPLSCVLNGRERYRPAMGETIVVLGAGPIGLLHGTLARHSGAANVIMSDPSPSRRATASKIGATTVVDPMSEDLKTIVKDLSHGRGADAVVVCIGRNELFVDALGLVRPGGRVNAFAGFPAGGSVSVDPNVIHYGEIEVSGTSNSRRDQAEFAMRLLEAGVIPCEEIVTHTFPLTKVVEAIEFTAKGEGVKIAVIP